jgi:hypothetical protein
MIGRDSLLLAILVGLTMLTCGCRATSDGGWLGQSVGPEPLLQAVRPPIPERGAYLGAILLEGQTSMTDFNAAVKRPHALFGEFFRFPEVVRDVNGEGAKLDRFLTQCGEIGAMAFVTTETFGGLDSYTPGDLTTLAKRLSGSGVSVFLRWNHEMNGSWYPWGQRPVTYIDRYREMAATMRQAPNVSLVWAPNQGWGYPWSGGAFSVPAESADFRRLDTNGDGLLDQTDDMYTPFYPGDDVVDWVGFSFYHWSNRLARGYNEVPTPGSGAGFMVSTGRFRCFTICLPRRKASP